MFATRVHALRLINPGQARLEYTWRVLHADGTEDTSGAGGGQADDALGFGCWLRVQACSCRLVARAHAANTAPCNTGLYSLSPTSGTIAPGASNETTLRFSPTEVEDCDRLLVCDIPDLDASCQPLLRTITGKVRAALRGALVSCATRSHKSRFTSTTRQGPRAVRLHELHARCWVHRCCVPGVTLSCLTVTT